MFRCVGVGANQDEDPVGRGRVRRPDLLAVDHVLLAVANGCSLQRCEVGAGVGLGESLRPEHVTLGDLVEEEILLFLRPGRHDRRADPVDIHVLRAAWLPDRPHLLRQDGRLPGGLPAAAVLGRPRGRKPAALGELASELPDGCLLLRCHNPAMYRVLAPAGPLLLEEGAERCRDTRPRRPSNRTPCLPPGTYSGPAVVLAVELSALYSRRARTSASSSAMASITGHTSSASSIPLSMASQPKRRVCRAIKSSGC